MHSDERQPLERLNEYLSEAERDLSAPVPDGVDPELAKFARQIDQQLRAPGPDPQFQHQLLARLSARMAESPVPVRRGLPAGIRRLLDVGAWRPAVGVATAAVVAVAMLLGVALLGRPQTVGAQEVIDRAQSVHSLPSNSQIKSLVMTSRSMARPVQAQILYGPGERIPLTPPNENFTIVLAPPPQGEVLHLETRQWYQAPDRVRVEMVRPAPLPAGEPSHQIIFVSDGQAAWGFAPGAGEVVRAVPPPRIGLGFSLMPGANQATELDQLLERARTCQTPTLRPEKERIAGREAHVVDLGPDRCTGLGSSTMWIDTQTFMVLKAVTYDPKSGDVFLVSEVTDIAFNVPIEPVRFEFAPSPGIRIDEGGPVRLRLP